MPRFHPPHSLRPGRQSPHLILALIALAFSQVALAQLEKPAMSAQETHPLDVGATVPDVTFEDIEGNSHSLHALLAKGPAVVLFYRGSWCPYCNAQLHKLADIEDQLTGLGYQILAISPDRPEKLAGTRDKHQLKAMLLSDSDIEGSLAFGLAFVVDDATLARYRDYHIDLEEASGESHHSLPVPAVYLVDKDKKIQFAYSNPDYRVRLEPDALLEAAKKHAP